MAQELEHGDKEFLQLADMADNTEIEHLENSLERFDMVSFDATIFDGMLFDNSLPFMVYKIYQHNGLISSYHIELINLVNFSREMQIGYFKDNPFHNVTTCLTPCKECTS